MMYALVFLLGVFIGIFTSVCTYTKRDRIMTVSQLLTKLYQLEKEGMGGRLVVFDTAGCWDDVRDILDCKINEKGEAELK